MLADIINVMIITHHREKLINATTYFANHTKYCGKKYLILLNTPVKNENILTEVSGEAGDYRENLTGEDLNSYYSDDLPEEKYVKCNYCSGTGWINKNEEDSDY